MAKSCCCYTNSSGLNSYYVTEPNAEVISLSPTTLKATKAFVCEICYKGFQRYQNLELHRRGHTLPLPWGLWQTVFSMLRKRVYVCPEPSCIHHNPAHAFGDFTAIKTHYSMIHGDSKKDLISKIWITFTSTFCIRDSAIHGETHSGLLIGMTHEVVVTEYFWNSVFYNGF